MLTDDQADPDLFDQLAEDTDERGEQDQAEVDQRPEWRPPPADVWASRG